jgi:electron transfer flavoprotein alpha subunit
MNTILVYVAAQDGQIKRSSLEVLSRCRELCGRDGLELSALIADPQAAELASTAATHGANRVYVDENPGHKSGPNRLLVDTLAHCITDSNPRLIAMASTESAKDILGALAVRTGAGVLPDVAAFDIESDRVVGSRPVQAARYLAAVHTTAVPAIVSVRSGSYSASEAAVEADIVPVTPPVGDVRETLLEIVRATGETVDLAEASVVVAAGRGVKDEAGRDLVHELADVLGAGIGSSRAVVESGLFPATSQIGQTGKVVSPTLYFAIGISGAIQHVAGMLGSRVIVAINKDADAPIFKVATYGIVGDLYKILPGLIQKLKARRAN